MDNEQLFNKVYQDGAIFSPTREHRYLLWRQWTSDHIDKPTRGTVTFIGLNPSTADEVVNDPTVTRCVNYAKAWGYDGMFMTNIFAFRATDPTVMKAYDNPIGELNDEALIWAVSRSWMTVCAWGNHGQHLERSSNVKKLLHPYTGLWYLKMNKSKEPSHPLYLKGNLEPTHWWTQSHNDPLLVTPLRKQPLTCPYQAIDDE